MIDVLHPGTSDASHHFAHAGSQRSARRKDASADQANSTAELEEDEEAAWLQSVQAAGVDEVTDVRELQSGNLVMDMSTLRDEPTSMKRSLKGRLPT